MKVLMLPDFRSANLYQSLLEKSLISKNVDVFFSNRISLLFPLTRNILETRADVLHIHWVSEYFGSAIKTFYIFLMKLLNFLFDITLVKYLLNTRIVWTVHNTQEHQCKHYHSELVERKYLSKMANSLICHSNSAKEKISNLYNVTLSKIHVIPHGNYIGPYENRTTRKESRKHLGLTEEDFILLYFGQIRKYKGVDILIKKFNLLNKPFTKLYIIGSPIDEQIKEQIISLAQKNENIKTVLRFIPNDEIQIYMNAADIIVLPYREVLTSGAVILAMSFGKPLIAPQMGCISDVLDEMGSFLYNPSKENGLLNSIIETLRSREKLSRMGKHNLQLAKKLDWDEIAEKTKMVYSRGNF